MAEDSFLNKDEADPNGLHISTDEPLDKNRNILDSAKKALNSGLPYTCLYAHFSFLIVFCSILFNYYYSKDFY